jgi:glycogen(starch) synthase
MPTKVFEYLAYGLPIISQSRTLWTNYALKHKACIPLNFDRVDAEKIAIKLQEFLNSYEPKDISEVKWKTEERKLVSLIDSLLA